MSNRTFAFVAFAATLFISGLAEANPPDGSPVTNVGMLQKLYAPIGPGPGIYTIAAAQSGLCLGPVDGDDANVNPNAQPPYIAQADCSIADPSYRRWAVLPSSQGGFTIRSLHCVGCGENSDPQKILSCASIDQGMMVGGGYVHVGERRVDLSNCSNRYGADWSLAGSDIQRFYFGTVADVPDAFALHSVVSYSDARYQCWNIRGESMNAGTDVILYDCGGGKNELFRFVRVPGPITQAAEAGALSRNGWDYDEASQSYLYSAAAPGVDLPGGDIADGHETANDNGVTCAKECKSDGTCRAYTWAQPGFRDVGPAVCWLKNSVPQPVWQAGVLSGVIRR